MKFFTLLLPAILLLGSCSLLVDFEDDKGLKERDCGDGVDNDGDGFTDCADQDCEEAPACTTVNNLNNVFNNVTNPELCNNGIDDDLDGMIDCDDDDCQGAQNCVGGDETDCGDGFDDDGNGLVDCQDPDCEQNPICLDDLQPCNAYVNYEAAGTLYHYYTDIYEFASSLSCNEDQICAIKPALSWVPHCYPPSPQGEVVPHYQPCGVDLPCGPGLICGGSMTAGSQVCLPLCAPGHHPECIGGQGICFNNIQNFQDGLNGQFMEIWTCDIPICNPLRPMESGCPSLQACYPDPSLFGAAACHQNHGLLPAGTPCPSGNDLDCAPGTICRGSDGGTPTCHALCLEAAGCGSDVGCIKEDPRQHFGFCQ